MDFSNTYITLGEQFYQRSDPTLVSKPTLQLFNVELAKQLGIDDALITNSTSLANYFSGNQLLPGAEPIALAYSGHQFGHFNPQLGDGRAHLLGEVISNEKQRFDVQLKGSGPTHFSRQGDGRCALGPAVREFIMSEAMYALGVPTTRCLAVVASGDMVYRDSPLPGAIVTRIASSHIRVGSFQYFAARGDLTALTALTDYAIFRHFPDLTGSLSERVLQFLDKVIERQVILTSTWMSIGFIHGVMNTDNTAISGETIDFGPCAMMGVYHPETVFSSIDRRGRYSYGNQPAITRWNMARLAEALLPLIDNDQDTAVAKVEPFIADFMVRYEQAYYTLMAKKIGFTLLTPENTSAPTASVIDLINQLLEQMQANQLDFTNTFIALTERLNTPTTSQALLTPITDWVELWLAQLHNQGISRSAAHAVMQQSNPLVIPRNHHMEHVLSACQEHGDCRAAEEFLTVLRSPFKAIKQTSKFQDQDIEGDQSYRTFCGT